MTDLQLRKGFIFTFTFSGGAELLWHESTAL